MNCICITYNFRTYNDFEIKNGICNRSKNFFSEFYSKKRPFNYNLKAVNPEKPSILGSHLHNFKSKLTTNKTLHQITIYITKSSDICKINKFKCNPQASLTLDKAEFQTVQHFC